MKYSLRTLMLAIVLVVCVLAMPFISSAEELTKTDGYDAEYATTFGFDFCGDTSYGQLYRQAIIVKVEACPFTEDAKKNFYIRALKTANSSLSELVKYFKENSSLPTQFLGGEKCSKIFAKPEVNTFKKKLEQFEQGNISISKFTKAELGSCEDGAKPVEESAPPVLSNSSSHESK